MLLVVKCNKIYKNFFVLYSFLHLFFYGDDIINRELDSSIPKEIQEEIFLNGKEQIIEVFRIAKNGTIDDTTFLSSYDEIRLGYIENKDLDSLNKNEFKNIGLYETSCDLKYSKAQKSLKLFMKHYPRPIIISGFTSNGLSQKTLERTNQKKDKHHLY